MVDDTKYTLSELKQTKDIVKRIMSIDEHARNSDRYLIGRVYEVKSGKTSWTIEDIVKMPNPESIIRMRARVQNIDGEFPPTIEGVKIKRHRRESTIKHNVNKI